MITWGISANSHDAALAVFENNSIVFASHTERFSGKKNDPHLNTEIIEYAQQWGLPDHIAWYEKPWLKTLRQLYARQGLKYRKNNIKNYLQRWNIKCPITTIDHHKSHAAAGYYTSLFDTATLLVIDAIGEFTTLSIWEAKDNELKCKHKTYYPNSVGLWYSAFTQRLGLKPNEDEYILMGMAAYGKPIYKQQILETFFNYDELLTKYWFSFPKIKSKYNLHRGCMWWEPTQKAFDIINGQQVFTQWAYDTAASVQAAYEELLSFICKNVKIYFPNKNFVFMGGCALNCAANQIIENEWKNVWIMPNPGDAGSSIGAVLAHREDHIKWPGPFLGYDIAGEYPIDQIIEELLQTGIAGVASGRAEFGPRAFGNRSLLADPRASDAKDRVNKIKQRQKFRPFAPAVLEEHADRIFRPPYGRYMQYTARCKYPEQYPAIVHADGTSRVQTVTKEDNKGFRALLERWYELTGCPMLLNTSLNIKGKPMVNNLTDADKFAIMYKTKVFS